MVKRSNHEDKQVLVDMAFQFALMLYHGDIKPVDRDHLTNWMRRNYAEMGFKGKPIGLSHYILDREDDAD